MLRRFWSSTGCKFDIQSGHCISHKMFRICRQISWHRKLWTISAPWQIPAPETSGKPDGFASCFIRWLCYANLVIYVRSSTSITSVLISIFLCDKKRMEKLSLVLWNADRKMERVMGSLIHQKMLVIMYCRYSLFRSFHELNISIERIYLINCAKFPWQPT